MKSTFRYALVALMGVGLFASCSDEKDAVGYSQFILHEPTFVSNGGSKVVLDGLGAWWEVSDMILVNGVPFVIEQNDDQWIATRSDGETDQVAPAIDDAFYIIYKGGYGVNDDVEWDDGTGEYTNVSFVDDDGSAIMPLAAKVTNNSVLLDPCCAVFNMKTGEPNASVTIEFDADNMPPLSGTVIPDGSHASQISETDDENWDSYELETDDEGYARLVIPMVGSSWQVNGMTFDINGNQYTAGENTINKGVIYNFDFTQLDPSK